MVAETYVANTNDWIQVSKNMKITAFQPYASALPTEQPFIRDTPLELASIDVDEIANIPKVPINSLEMVKEKIKAYIDRTSELPDQEAIAEDLQVELELVNDAYEELVKEGVVHRETFYLFKDPATRKRLLEAVESDEEIPLKEVRERLGI